MSKDLPWLDRIKAGTKTIEFRWYNQKRRPWQAIAAGDRLFFKDTGGYVTVVAQVSRVLFFADLNPTQVASLLDQYGKQLGLFEGEWYAFFQKVAARRFCILIFLEEVKKIVPFSINKKGFGAMSAWITTPDLYRIKKP